MSLMRHSLCLGSLLILLAAAAFARDVQNPSGLPIPRFVSLKSDEVNIRTGPGTRYPIQWVYRKEGWPVEVIEEFDHWRKIRDMEGTAGWAHKTMLDGRRTALVRGKGPHTVRTDASDKARPVLKAEPGVLCRLVECKREWCRVQVASRKGWLPKSALYGVYPQETFD